MGMNNQTPSQILASRRRFRRAGKGEQREKKKSIRTATANHNGNSVDRGPKHAIYEYSLLQCILYVRIYGARSSLSFGFNFDYCVGRRLGRYRFESELPYTHCRSRMLSKKMYTLLLSLLYRIQFAFFPFITNLDIQFTPWTPLMNGE